MFPESSDDGTWGHHPVTKPLQSVQNLQKKISHTLVFWIFWGVCWNIWCYFLHYNRNQLVCVQIYSPTNFPQMLPSRKFCNYNSLYSTKLPDLPGGKLNEFENLPFVNWVNNWQQPVINIQSVFTCQDGRENSTSLSPVSKVSGWSDTFSASSLISWWFNPCTDTHLLKCAQWKENFKQTFV